jgi:hypothetical protein
MIRENYNKSIAEITFTKCGNIANAFRRALLSEIPTIAFNVDDATLETDDTLITHDILNTICFARFLNCYDCDIPLNSKFEINVTAENENTPVFSDYIVFEGTNKPAPLEKHVLICHLNKKRNLRIRGIKVCRGTSVQHAKHRALTGLIIYDELDFCYVNYVNINGRLNYKKIIAPEKYNRETQYVYIEKGADMTERVEKQIKKYTQLKDIREVQHGVDICDSYFLSYECDEPKKLFNAARESLVQRLKNIKLQHDGIEVDITIRELLSWFCHLETDCNIFYNNGVLTIVHDNKEKIIKNAVEKILKILNH